LRHIKRVKRESGRFWGGKRPDWGLEKRGAGGGTRGSLQERFPPTHIPVPKKEGGWGGAVGPEWKLGGGILKLKSQN